MGTWALDVFSNDSAADFLTEAAQSPARSVTAALKAVASTKPAQYIEVDDGGAALAACELVAVAFGFGQLNAMENAQVAELVEQLKPSEPQRKLALAALARITDVKTSELAQLWHNSPDTKSFSKIVKDLQSQLKTAAKGPRPVPKAKAGDLVLLPSGDCSVLVQILGPREVAVFEGPCGAAAEDHAANQKARRVAASAQKVFVSGKFLGNIALRRDLKGKKRYASELGQLSPTYAVTSVSFGQIEQANYEEALKYELLKHYAVHELVMIALHSPPIPKVRSLAEREAALAADCAEHWAQRRGTTTPHAFGDVARLREIIEWMNSHGVENAIRVHNDIAAGRQGYGRPNELAERGSYAFCGIVAYWRNKWGKKELPKELVSIVPAPPAPKLLAQATHAAQQLTFNIITPDAELRLIWQRDADRGAGLERALASLRAALT